MKPDPETSTERKIIVSGLPGVGKSTLLLRLREEGYETCPEATDENDNPLLSHYYENPKDLAFAMQIFFLTMRLLAKPIGHGPDVCCERNPLEDTVYAEAQYRIGNISKEEYWWYQEYAKACLQIAGAPDLIVYLKISPIDCLKAIKTRGRVYEQGIDVKYLELLTEIYESKFDQMKKDFPSVKIIEVDWTHDCSPESPEFKKKVLNLHETIQSLLSPQQLCLSRSVGDCGIDPEPPKKLFSCKPSASLSEIAELKKLYAKKAVEVSGTIAAGKTTFAQAASEILGREVRQELVGPKRNQFLEKFYSSSNTAVHSVLTQLFMDCSRMQIPREPMIADRSFPEGRVFMDTQRDLGALPQEYYDFYVNHFYDKVIRYLPGPQITVFIETPLDTCIYRLEQRGDKNIPREYLYQLNENYRTYALRLLESRVLDRITTIDQMTVDSQAYMDSVVDVLWRAILSNP
jgi:deoxyadenosine/deoxycytidine kinase